MVAGNQWKHLEFTSAIKIDPFALLNRWYPHKHFSQYLNSLQYRSEPSERRTRFAALDCVWTSRYKRRIERISMYELDYCSFLLLLCEKELTTFSKQNIRYEYDVFSRSRHVLILSYPLNILAITCRPGHADLLFWLANKMIYFLKKRQI